jgi:4-hydroxybenzoate-CoA ligase
MANENGNAACYFVDRNAAGDNADHSAFIEADTGIAISYRDLGVETGRMAGLFQRFDIRPEERVALLSLDEIAFPVIFWGSLQAGVIPVCLNTLLSTDVYSTILKDCRARALFVSAALYPTIEPLLPDHPYIRDVFVIGGETPAGRFNFADELAASEPGGTMHVSGDDFAFWLYSSGSTGQPKGVRHVHSSLQATADTYAAQVLGIEQKDIVYSVVKLFLPMVWVMG